MYLCKNINKHYYAISSLNPNGTKSSNASSNYIYYTDMLYVKFLTKDSSDHDFYNFYKNIKDDKFKNLIVKCYYSGDNKYIFDYHHFDYYHLFNDSIMEKNILNNKYGEKMMIMQSIYDYMFFLKKIYDNNKIFADDVSGNTLLTEKLELKIIDYGSFRNIKKDDDRKKNLSYIVHAFDNRNISNNIPIENWDCSSIEPNEESIEKFLESNKKMIDDIRQKFDPKKIIHNYVDAVFYENVTILGSENLLKQDKIHKYEDIFKDDVYVENMKSNIEKHIDIESIKTNLSVNIRDEHELTKFDLCYEFLTKINIDEKKYKDFIDLYANFSSLAGKILTVYACVKIILNIIDAYMFYSDNMTIKIKTSLKKIFVYKNMFELRFKMYRDAFIFYDYKYDGIGDVEKDDFYMLIKELIEFIKNKKIDNINVDLLITFLTDSFNKNYVSYLTLLHTYHVSDLKILNETKFKMVNEIKNYCENIENKYREINIIIATLKLFNEVRKNEHKESIDVNKEFSELYSALYKNDEHMTKIVIMDKTIEIEKLYEQCLNYREQMNKIIEDTPEKIVKSKYRKYKLKMLTKR